MSSIFRKWFLPFFLWMIYRLLALTWRVRVHESESLKRALEKNEGFVAAHWHGDELVLLLLIRRYRIAAMTSTSRDGELMDTIVRLQGGRTSRGSSTRGGVRAIKGIMDLVKAGFNPSVAVDGPKGPLHEPKPGVFELSRMLEKPIFPIAVHAQNAFVFKKSWNQTMLPKPFSTIHVYWGENLLPVSREQDPRDPQFATQLKNALNDAKQCAANS